MNADFWQSKRVLITGHTGFKGSWLSLWLQSLGAHVVGYALDPPTEPNLFDTARVAERMLSIPGDVLNKSALQSVIAEHRPEVIFHLAAQSLVRESYKNPVETFSTNVMGLAHLLEGVRTIGGVRAVVCVTSDKCYQNREWVWGYREDEPMGGYDPYSSSKGCSELVAAAYRNSFFNEREYSQHGVSVATARAGNVIGGGDWAKDRLVPDLIRSVIRGQDIVLRNPHAIRPWQHVLDPLAGYLMLAESLFKHGPRFSEAWNFAPAESHTVTQVVEQLLSLWGSQVSAKHDQSRQPHEDPYMILDSTKARVKLEWKALLDLRASLSWIVEWVKRFQAGADMRSVTESQIKAYMDMVEISRTGDQAQNYRPAHRNNAELLDLLYETIMIRDREGRIKYWNRGADEMYGWKSEEALGSISHELLRTKFPKSLGDIESDLTREGCWQGELVHTRRDGRTIVVKSRWVLKQDGRSNDGEVVEINQICGKPE
ncbi:MAG TPA: CDP-glucose 4,6-dehydratase [Candidatus Binatia bacterium]